MSIVFSSFTDYLDMLPQEQARHGDALRSQVRQQVQEPSSAGLSAFLFLPDQLDHPDHDDAAQVFAQAVEQMYLPRPLVDDEIPLLFLGYHAMNRFSGKRTSQGFLLTDQAIYVQDDFTVLSAAPAAARGQALPTGVDVVQGFVSPMLAGYKAWKDWADLAQCPQSDLSARCGASLQAVIGTVIGYHAQHGSLRQPRLREWKLAELVAEHDAGEALLDPLNPKLSKKLGKVIGKFQIPADEALQFALVDFPLFGGPYGLALTSKALYGKDLMESPSRIALAQVDASALQISEKGDRLSTGANPPIALPSYTDAAFRDPFLGLLKQEIVRLQSQA